MSSSQTDDRREKSQSPSDLEESTQCPDDQNSVYSDSSFSEDNDSKIDEKENESPTKNEIRVNKPNPLQNSTFGGISQEDMAGGDKSELESKINETEHNRQNSSQKPPSGKILQDATDKKGKFGPGKCENNNQQKKSKQNTETKDSSSYIYIIIPIIMLITALLVRSFLPCLCGGTKKKCDDTNIKTSIQEIALKYPLQNYDVWDHLQSGIQRLINEEKEPMVFFLVQWSDESQTAFNIAMEAGEVTARNLTCPWPKEPIVLTPNLINSNERGELIESYKGKLEREHVLIIKDIEKVSPIVAQDFRYFCDEENPVVGKAVIFFIMNMNNCTGVTLSDVYDGPRRDTITAVEKCLTEFWGTEDGLDSAVLYPVLSRIVSVVLPIRDAEKKL